jgi:hypothetical protein
LSHREGIEGRVDQVFLARDPDSLESAEASELRATLEGLEGDNHFGPTMFSNARTPYYPRGTPIRNSRQVSIVSVEELKDIASSLGLPEVRAEWLGANLLVNGIPRLSLLPPSSKLFFPGGAVLVVQGENAPCTGPGRVIQSRYPDVPGLVSGFPKNAVRLRGLVAWVEHPGVIKKGDPLTVLLCQQAPWKAPAGDHA